MRKTLMVISMLLLSLPSFAGAQQERPSTRLALGGGLSYAGGDGRTTAGAGVAGHVGLLHQRGPVVLGARFGMTRGASTGEAVSGGGTLHDRYDDIGIMAGYAFHRRPGFQAVMSAGVASVSGERVQPDSSGNRPFGAVIGIPVQLDIGRPRAARSVGVALYANFNAEEHYATLTLSYVIGRRTQ